MRPPSLSTAPFPGRGRPLSFLEKAESGYERSLLRESQMSAWAGFRVGLFEAASIELKGQYGEHAAIAMILRGRARARIRSRGETCDFSPGVDSVGLFAPRFEVGWTQWHCEPGSERLFMELDLNDLERRDDLDAMLPRHRGLRQDLTLRDRQLATLGQLIATEVRQGSPHGALYATSLSLSLAAYLFNHHANGGANPSKERGLLTGAQKVRVLETIDLHLAADIGLDELASAAGVSRFHFTRLFKNTFDTTPHRFLMEQRIAKAQRLLESTKMSLAEVAAATGFSSQSHLCTAVRRRLGVTPGTWRRARGTPTPSSG